MPQPKKLKTLQQALNTTSKPLARFGDLIAVQVYPQLMAMNPRDFPNGEMRSIFMPDHRDWTVLRFPRGETDAFLQDLYAAGGWIESIADYDDEALALHYNFTAGINVGGYASNAGDARCFELDCIEAVGNLPPHPSRELVSVVVNTVRLMHKKYKLTANVGTQFQEQQNDKSKRKRPVKDDIGRTLDDVISAVARDHPGSRPREIWPHLKVAIGDWSGDAVIEIGEAKSRAYKYKRPTAENDSDRTISYEWFAEKLRETRKRENRI